MGALVAFLLSVFAFSDGMQRRQFVLKPSTKKNQHLYVNEYENILDGQQPALDYRPLYQPATTTFRENVLKAIKPSELLAAVDKAHDDWDNKQAVVDRVVTLGEEAQNTDPGESHEQWVNRIQTHFSSEMYQQKQMYFRQMSSALANWNAWQTKNPSQAEIFGGLGDPDPNTWTDTGSTKNIHAEPNDNMVCHRLIGEVRLQTFLQYQKSLKLHVFGNTATPIRCWAFVRYFFLVPGLKQDSLLPHIKCVREDENSNAYHICLKKFTESLADEQLQDFLEHSNVLALWQHEKNEKEGISTAHRQVQIRGQTHDAGRDRTSTGIQEWGE